jgi:hypothetical protein
MLRNERRPIAFFFVDIYFSFSPPKPTRVWNRSIRSSHKVYEIESRSSHGPNFGLAGTAQATKSRSAVSPVGLRRCSQVASASVSDSLNCAVSGALSGSGEGRKIKDALLAGETVETGGRVKENRVEVAPARVARPERNGELPGGPDAEMVALCPKTGCA